MNFYSRNQANASIRQLMRSQQIPQWRVAQQMQISEGHLNRLLRIELSDTYRSKVLEAIEAITSDS